MGHLLLLVIFPAPDVVMDDRFFSRGGFRQLLFVKAGFQDRFDALVAVGFQMLAAEKIRPKMAVVVPTG
ncbi:hypothetical protein KN63_01480 [Smithella sp. F21]|nr:hypothetical protein KN63_01480 [Smithella sp. F21]